MNCKSRAPILAIRSELHPPGFPTGLPTCADVPRLLVTSTQPSHGLSPGCGPIVCVQVTTMPGLMRSRCYARYTPPPLSVNVLVEHHRQSGSSHTVANKDRAPVSCYWHHSVACMICTSHSAPPQPGFLKSSLSHSSPPTCAASAQRPCG
jgi:hypothetical protein